MQVRFALNFTVPAEFRREFKAYAAAHDLKLNRLLALAPEPVDYLALREQAMPPPPFTDSMADEELAALIHLRRFCQCKRETFCSLKGVVAVEVHLIHRDGPANRRRCWVNIQP